MSRYDEIFEQVADARPLNTWEANIPEGAHQVALVKYGPKVSGKDRSVFLEAEFVVLSTNNENVRVGSRYSWPWFINKPDEFGYTHARAKDFLENVQGCIGNEENVKQFGAALAADFETDQPQAYGLVLDATVECVTDGKGNRRLGRKGNEVFNVTWGAISQDDADIEATRAKLAEIDTQPSKAKPRPVTRTVAPEPATTPQPNGKKKLGGLSALRGS